MTLSTPSLTADISELSNIGLALTLTAHVRPDQVGVAAPRRGGGYRTATFAELDEDSDLLASGLLALGLEPGWRVALMVRPGIEFVTLVFALFKAGAVIVLIDPGMGRANLIACLERIAPKALVAIPQVQLLWHAVKHRFPEMRLRVVCGSGWAGGVGLDRVRRAASARFTPAATRPEDPAAIIFTTGSTGPPKGVLYRHRNFAHQVCQIQSRYGIEPGEIDLPGFPLFGLFNAAMGVTTVVPNMDPTRPARVDPERILRAMHDWKVTQAFGSPAMWNRVGKYCHARGIRLPHLRRVLSAGAPVPAHVLRWMSGVVGPGGDIHTPYGATEALPIASISARQVLNETAERSSQGAGTCVGTRFDGVQWRVIRIADGPIEDITEAECLPTGEIGELIVRGPVVTAQYVDDAAATAMAKIRDDAGFWHRMGDVGYLDEQDRFWFCGRKAHRVTLPHRTLFTVPCEAIFNRHPRIYRSALVGVRSAAGKLNPAVVCEPWPDKRPRGRQDARQLIDELFHEGQSSELTNEIRRDAILLRRALPVDIRHNSKIFREQVAMWAQRRLQRQKPAEPPSGSEPES